MKPAHITHLSPALAASLAYLESLHTQRMTLEDRAELTLGYLLIVAKEICDTVTDWSQPRPVMPLSSWQAWIAAYDLVKGVADGVGDAAWEYACKSLSADLKFGYASYCADIA